jgi:hypothetical protein
MMLLERSQQHCFSILLFRKFREYDDRFLHFALILALLIGPTDLNRLDDSEKSSRGRANRVPNQQLSGCQIGR